MQTIQNGYRGLNLLMQLGADRVFVFLAIGLSLAVAAGFGFELLSQQVPVVPEIY